MAGGGEGGGGWGLLRGLLKEPQNHPSHRRWLLPVAPPSSAQNGAEQGVGVPHMHAHTRAHMHMHTGAKTIRARAPVPALHPCPERWCF